VWAWGNGSDGQLGDGMILDSPVPKAISMVDAAAAAAGKAHTLAVAPLGSLAACGLNVSGQLGDGMNADNELVPAAVPEFADVLTVAASGNLSLGLAGDAGLWAWGQNFSGQLGLGDNADRPTPTQVPGLPPVRAIAAGLAHTVVFDENGAVWAWGLNSFGQLGKGDSGNATNSAVPLLVTLL
jgi:alpha-tubulin suppressor-like RCC1 family protein